ncbi:MAG: helicase-exonuclease AddAB subunit AddA [Eubacteriales bacterium]|nr:helicase-exonuclease AddAB subunit AddA [Eubacteriales bacterium]
MNFTEEQRQAVYTRGQNILVSAGAGAGKTRVLVSRMVEMILDEDAPMSADGFLVMTFTNAAAAEMKERITEELEGRLSEHPENQYVRRQLRMLKYADISTVHSFCNRLIRRHFNEAGIDPSFRIGEEGELFLLRQKAMEDMLEEAYADGRERFFSLVEAYAPEKNDDAIVRMVEEWYRFSRGFPDKKQWEKHVREEAKLMEDRETVNQSGAVRLLVQKGREILKEMEREASEGIALLEQGGPERFWTLLYQEKEKIKECLQGDDYESLQERISSLELGNTPRATKEEKQWKYLEEIKKIHKDIKEKAEETREKLFSLSLDTICEENRKLRPFLEELFLLTNRYEELYFRQKREKNVFDFDDLEHIALSLLVDGYDDQGNPLPSETARELSRRYKEIFVDEYQDTNLVQEALLTVLCREGENHLFVVGDVKQSIYRFRQARPDLFINRYQNYQNQERMARKEQDCRGGKNITLRDNFRSSPGVLSFCNLLFRGLMEKEFGGVDYTKEIELRPGGSGGEEKGKAAEILLLVKDEEQKNLDREVSAVEGEAAVLTKKICAMKAEGHRYKDMVILLRSGAGLAEPLAECLNASGIPAVCENKTGYFQTREIQLVLNYLAVVDNVYQDIPMASVLLSSIGGLEEEELACLKLQVLAPRRREYSLYELIRLFLQEEKEGRLFEKLKKFWDDLMYFRKRKKEEPLHELLWEIYTRTGVYYDVQLMPEGEERKENLLMLLKKAEDYEKTVFKGLFYFLRYMEKLRTYEMDMGTAALQEEKEDIVRIMTVHKSKGLEFPIVFVSGLSKKFNFMDGNRPVLMHPDMGIGMEYVDVEKRMHHPSVMKKAIREQMKKETLEEELRILYVAVTRAKERIILTGVIEQKKTEEKPPAVMTIEKKLSARCFLDWIWMEKDRLPIRLVHFHEIEQELVRKKETSEENRLWETLEKEGEQADLSHIKKSFAWEYPYRHMVDQKRKYSVSELKKLSMVPLEIGGVKDTVAGDEGVLDVVSEEEVPIPLFLQEEEQTLAPVFRGTLVHKIMELLPIGKIETKKELFQVLQEIEKQHPEVKALSMKKVYQGIEHFLFSEIGDKIRKMDKEGKLKKELPFTVGLPASMVYGTEESEERIVVQGVIDLCGEDEEGIWLLDYKTDFVGEGEECLLLDRYKIQMLYYKAALEQILHKKVVHSCIYSFALRRYLEFI